MNTSVSETIRAKEQQNCILCGERGTVMHANLNDRLFGTPGRWNLYRCSNSSCNLAWLNPMPFEDDLSLAYSCYYTHGQGRESNNRVATQNFFATSDRFSTVRARRSNAFLMYLKYKPPGKILEIGCGDGSRLVAFRELGWKVLGQETDPSAVKRASEIHKLEVLDGNILDHALPECSFDAIIMNHVLEHIHNPEDILSECRRLLNKSGTLSIATPNLESLGHRLFGRDWRGLEPPRHLYIYSSGALKLLAEKAGYKTFSIFTRAVNAAGTITQESYWLRDSANNDQIKNGSIRIRVLSHFFRVWEIFINYFKRNVGEECILLMKKD